MGVNVFIRSFKNETQEHERHNLYYRVYFGNISIYSRVYYIGKGCVVCALCHDLMIYGRRKKYRKNIS